MARIEVSWVPMSAQFADRFDVIRRPEVISQFGRATTEQVVATAIGTIYPTGDNSLVRQTDYELGRKTLTCVTTYRLQIAAPGHQPDVVLYRGNEYIVTAVEDYSQYGAGFVVAQLSSIRAIDQPPQ